MLDPLAARHVRRNFILGVANGAFFNLAETLMDPTTVLAAFVRLLGGSPLLIGFLFPIRDGLWFLPQLWVSSFIQSEPRKMPLYNWMTLFRGVVWGLLAGLMLTVRDPQTLLIGFFVLYLLLRLGAGMSGLSFMDVVAKTVAPPQRGQYFGWRNLTGSLLSIGVGGLVGVLTGASSPLLFPVNFGALLAISWVSGTVGMLLFSFVVEPREPVQPRVSLRAQLGHATQLVREHADYRRFLLLRIILLFAQSALVFFEGYAGRSLGLAPEAVGPAIGAYLTASTIAGILANLVWGRVSEARGNRAVMRWSLVVGVLAVVLVPAIAWMRVGGLSVELCLVLFALAFALARIHISGTDVAAGPLLLEMAPASQRALYIGTSNTILGVALLSTSVSGQLVEVAGYDVLFVLSLLCFAGTAYLAWRIAEPRATLIAVGGSGAVLVVDDEGEPSVLVD